jgi:competence protein ComEC
VFVLGILRAQISEFNIENDKLSELNGKGQIVLTGVISNEPDVRDTSQKIKVKVSDSIVLVTTNRYPEYQYLDEVKITGNLEAPVETEDFSYKNYLMKDGIYSVMGFPKIDKIGKEKGNMFSVIYSGILALKQKLRESINKNFSPPEGLILQGMILGDKTAIPQDIKKELSVTGVSHIIAVSGTHIVILSSIIMSLLLAIGLWRGQAFYFSVIFICFYILLVGLPASGVRSGIMGILYLFGQKIGRQSTSSRIIVLAGSLMLLQNPLLLLYDVGFQLSFLAVLGLIYFEPLIRAFLKFLIKRFFRKEVKERYDSALMMLSSTISAQVFTLPVIVYNFGNISFISPLVNILILPIVYYLMLFGFLSALFGAAFSWLGWIISIPCYFLMMYFMKVVELFSKPWAYKIIENVHWIWLLVSYFIIVFAIWFLNRKFTQKFV